MEKQDFILTYVVNRVAMAKSLSESTTQKGYSTFSLEAASNIALTEAYFVWKTIWETTNRKQES